MKYLITLFAGYLLPSIAPYINLDIVLGIVAGVLFGLLVAMLFVGPTPTPAPKLVTPRVNKAVRKPRRIIEQPAPKEWTFTPINYEWSVA